MSNQILQGVDVSEFDAVSIDISMIDPTTNSKYKKINVHMMLYALQFQTKMPSLESMIRTQTKNLRNIQKFHKIQNRIGFRNLNQKKHHIFKVGAKHNYIRFPDHPRDKIINQIKQKRCRSKRSDAQNNLSPKSNITPTAQTIFNINYFKFMNFPQQQQLPIYCQSVPKTMYAMIPSVYQLQSMRIPKMRKQLNLYQYSFLSSLNLQNIFSYSDKFSNDPNILQWMEETKEILNYNLNIKNNNLPQIPKQCKPKKTKTKCFKLLSPQQIVLKADRAIWERNLNQIGYYIQKNQSQNIKSKSTYFKEKKIHQRNRRIQRLNLIKEHHKKLYKIYGSSVYEKNWPISRQQIMQSLHLKYNDKSSISLIKNDMNSTSQSISDSSFESKYVEGISDPSTNLDGVEQAIANQQKELIIQQQTPSLNGQNSAAKV